MEPSRGILSTETPEEARQLSLRFNTGSRKYTVKKDVPDTRDHLAMKSANVLPSKVDLSRFLGVPKDQGSAGSCTAHAGTEMREFLYRQFHQYEKHNDIAPADFKLSPLFLYAQERVEEGTFNSDDGAQSRTMMMCLAKYGCCLENSDKYSADNIYNKPTPAQIEEAKKYANVSYHRVLDVETAKSVLASGYACTLGMPVYANFDRIDHTGKLGIPGGHDAYEGGHEVLIFGYDNSFSNLDGTIGAFYVRNSWGDGWGDKGNFYIPYSYLYKYSIDWDMWVCHLGRPWK